MAQRPVSSRCGPTRGDQCREGSTGRGHLFLLPGWNASSKASPRVPRRALDGVLGVGLSQDGTGVRSSVGGEYRATAIRCAVAPRGETHGRRHGPHIRV